MICVINLWKAFFPHHGKSIEDPGKHQGESFGSNILNSILQGYRFSQFKHYYLLWKRVRNPVMHIEHKAGEKMYVDYAGGKTQGFRFRKH